MEGGQRVRGLQQGLFCFSLGSLVLMMVGSSLVVLAASDPDETAALMAFKARVTEPGNSLKTSWTGDDPCGSSWTGITCTPIAGLNYVTQITLPWMGLGGTLAPELGNLTQLSVLNLKFNNIEGSIPSAYGRLKNLFRLLLNNNKLSGELPSELGSLGSLRRFQINSNYISGPIPPTFGNLTSCLHFHFSNNNLNGSIPNDLGRLPKLLHLLLDNNQLIGPLPSDLSNIPTLDTIQLDNNNFSATIPPSWFQISSLYKLSLANCSLSGTIPGNSNLGNLTYLDLSNNGLTGNLTSSLPTSMLNIDLGNNKLNGTIPDNYGTMNFLQALMLQNNNFTGVVPALLGTGESFSNTSLQTKVVVNMEGNQLQGLVGSALSDAVQTGLTVVWMAGNPLCNLLDNQIKLELHCNFESNGTIYNSAPSSPNNCTTQNSLSCPPSFSVATGDGSDCYCAQPAILVIELISPPFVFFTGSLMANLSDYLHTVCYYPYDSPLIELQSSMWIVNPYSNSVLQVTVLLYPVNNGTEWDPVQFDQLAQNLTNFIYPANDDGLDFEPEYLSIGPYEIIKFSREASNTRSSHFQAGAVVGIVVGCAIITALAAVLLVLYLQKWGCVSMPFNHKMALRPVQRELFMPTRFKLAGVKSFTFAEMVEATNSFIDDLGKGSYGKVYKGILDDGTIVAIKRAHGGQVQGSDAFYTEIELLSRVHHKHLVELIGFCDDDGEQMLVYEFMSGGTLRDHLIPTEVMHFVTRMRIALATARGILYLHCDANPPIIHRDIKANNILLDDHFNAKVADFGLSRLAPMPNFIDANNIQDHVTTLVKGTPGYLDPEYFLTQKLTDKSDVYSFGVVLLELITGLQPIYHGKNLVREVLVAYDNGALENMVDPCMPTPYPPKAVELFFTLAIECCRNRQEERPTMIEVVRRLEDVACTMEPWSKTVQSFDSFVDIEEKSDGLIQQFVDGQSSSHVSSETIRSDMVKQGLASLGGR